MVVTKHTLISILVILGATFALYGREPLQHAQLPHTLRRRGIVPRMAPTPVEYDARNTNASSSSLDQRVPLQPWETMRDKGARQSCYFSMAIKDMDNAQEWLPEPNFGTPRKSQSEFTSYSELGANGWRVKVSTVDDMFDEETISLHTKTFSALDISADLSTWRTVDITHLDTKVIKGKVFPVSIPVHDS